MAETNKNRLMMIFTDIIPQEAIDGRYEISYVVLSCLVAFLASFAAFDFALKLCREEAPVLRRFWHIGGAILVGTGIWCMHFTGMLAFNMGMRHSYDSGLTVLSLLLPIVFAYGLFQVIKCPSSRRKTLLYAAPFLGLAILSMHYTGMAAMTMPVELVYTPGWSLIAVLIAILASATSLWLIFIYASLRSRSRLPYHFMAAILMAVAICGVHYAGMKAAVFVPLPGAVVDSGYPDKPKIVAFGIGVIALLVFALALGVLRINEIMTRQLKDQVAKRTEELEKANRALIRAKEMAESANIAKSEFLASMSHEIRTPMNAVIGIANILRNNMVPPEKKEEFLETLQVSAESLLGLLNEILDISKIEANKIQLENIGFNLRELTEEIIALITIRAEEKGLTVLMDYDDACAVHYRGDPLRVRQIIVNLLSNAVKFTDEGFISVKVMCPTAVAGKPRMVEILIQDSGIGIAEEKIGAIFEKFTQADTTTTRKYGGSGLGLSICAALAEKMNGHIRVVSTPGKGSTFILSLPLIEMKAKEFDASSETVEEEARPADEPAGLKPLILLVEDSGPNIMVATSYLENLGYRYEVARDGREAIALYRKKRFGLILMDIHMPELDGFDVTRAIRERESVKGDYTPIIALTSFATMHDREKCMRHGMDDYISKPFRMEELKTKMAHFLNLREHRADTLTPLASMTIKKDPVIVTEPFLKE